MRIGSVLRSAEIALITIISALVLGTCGGSGRRAVVQPQDRVAPPVQAAINTSLDEALAELDELECPDGVDEELWGELKGALEEALVANPPGRRGLLAPQREEPGWLARPTHGGRNHGRDARATSVVPTGEANRVNDLSLDDHFDATYTLTWHYKNLGDYDQNGTVGISDITPLAIHYNEEVPEDDTEQRNSIQAVVDGSDNGIVDIADITPIAMYYATECAAYSIRGALSNPESIEDTTEIGTAPIALAEGDDRKTFSAELTEEPRTYIAVAAMDTDEVPGELSNMVLIPNHPPVAQLLAEPTEGDAPLDVAFNASGSSDIDGPIAKYEWDWEGDGVFDHDSGSVPTVEHTYDIAQIYDPQVRITDGHNGSDTAEITVTAGAWHIFVAVDVEDCYDHAWHVNLEVVNGHPAISYWGSFDGLDTDDFIYVRANDSDGTTWGDTVLIASGDWIMQECADNSLAIVNGRPAIACYMDYNDEKGLWYVRALDENGSAWDEPLWLGEMDSEPYNSLSMAVVDERPAITYRRDSLQYIRALDADGNTWGSPVVASPEYARWMSHAVIDGAPGICYNGDNGKLRYVRAFDTDGTVWGEPVTADPEAAVVDSNLAEVNGRPAIAYVNTTYDPNNDFRYVRASDPDGDSWGAPVILDSSTEGVLVGAGCSLNVINGRPAIAYVHHGFRYIEARDINGEDWREPVTLLDEEGVVWFDSLKEVNGHPAVAYSFWGELGNRQVRFAVYY